MPEMADEKLQHNDLGSYPAVSVHLRAKEQPKYEVQLSLGKYSENQRKWYNLIGRPIISSTKLQLELRPVYIKFFIRTALDPLGIRSPRFEATADMKLEEIFYCYLSETYDNHPLISSPQEMKALKDYSFMQIDLRRRTLGARYSYAQAKELGLRVWDTEWLDSKVIESTHIVLVSSDRIPKGSYKSNEPSVAKDMLLAEDEELHDHDPTLVMEDSSRDFE